MVINRPFCPFQVETIGCGTVNVPLIMYAIVERIRRDPMKPVICLEPLYQELKPEDKIERIAAAGFQYVEFWGWRDKNVPTFLCEFCLRISQHHNRSSRILFGRYADRLLIGSRC